MHKTADEIIGPGLDKFYTLRPRSFQHINLRTGTYWHPWAAQRAQASLALQYLTELVQSNTLDATGQSLLDYVRSEFSELPEANFNGLQAVGEVTLTRPTGLSSGNVAKGYRFFREANDSTQVPWEAAEYETTADAYVDVGQLSVTIPIRAVSAGKAANHLLRTDAVTANVKPAGPPLFDPTLTVSAFDAGGGADTRPDQARLTQENEDYVREYARAFSKGQYGPTRDASKYGALKALGIRHALSYDDLHAATERVLVADESWGSSELLARTAQQLLVDEGLIGFGCVVTATRVRNKLIAARCNVVLRDWQFTSKTDEIDKSIDTAVRDYFDKRADWNLWQKRPLRAAITGAHERILKCSSVMVVDVNGVEVAEVPTLDMTAEQFHYMLTSGAVTITYSGPT